MADLPQVECLVKEALVQTAAAAGGGVAVATVENGGEVDGGVAGGADGGGGGGGRGRSGDEGAITSDEWLGRALLHTAESCVRGVRGGEELGGGTSFSYRKLGGEFLP